MATQAKKGIDIFAKAKGKTAEAPKNKKTKETIWQISPTSSGPATPEQLNTAIDEMHRIFSARSKLETEEKTHKAMLKVFADEQYVDHLARTGAEPESPLKLANDKHLTVTFVVQDRGHLTKVTDEHISTLTSLVGEDAVNELVYTAGEFAFDSVIMGQQGPKGDSVQELISEAISTAVQKLHEAGKLSDGQVEGLVKYTEERRFRPGILKMLVGIVGRHKAKLEGVIAAMGGAIVRYVKC